MKSIVFLNVGIDMDMDPLHLLYSLHNLFVLLRMKQAICGFVIMVVRKQIMCKDKLCKANVPRLTISFNVVRRQNDVTQS